jgi:hypothetical protein
MSTRLAFQGEAGDIGLESNREKREPGSEFDDRIAGESQKSTGILDQLQIASHPVGPPGKSGFQKDSSLWKRTGYVRLQQSLIISISNNPPFVSERLYLAKILPYARFGSTSGGEFGGLNSQPFQHVP